MFILQRERESLAILKYYQNTCYLFLSLCLASRSPVDQPAKLHPRNCGLRLSFDVKSQPSITPMIINPQNKFTMCWYLRVHSFVDWYQVISAQQTRNFNNSICHKRLNSKHTLSRCRCCSKTQVGVKSIPGGSAESDQSLARLGVVTPIIPIGSSIWLV